MYAVVVYYKFDTHTCVYLFDDYKKASEYLEAMWEFCYNAELADGSDVNEEETYHMESYAQIQWGYDGNMCRTWEIIPVSEPLKINGKNWR